MREAGLRGSTFIGINNKATYMVAFSHLEESMSVPDYRKDIIAFMKMVVNNQWITYPKFSVYIRKARHRVDPYNVLRCLDVANINVDTKYQKKGIFTEWLTQIEDQAKNSGLDCVYVENILNEHLEKFLIKRGYTRTGETTLPSYYLMVNGKVTSAPEPSAIHPEKSATPTHQC